MARCAQQTRVPRSRCSCTIMTSRATAQSVTRELVSRVELGASRVAKIAKKRAFQARAMGPATINNPTESDYTACRSAVATNILKYVTFNLEVGEAGTPPTSRLKRAPPGGGAADSPSDCSTTESTDTPGSDTPGRAPLHHDGRRERAAFFPPSHCAVPLSLCLPTVPPPTTDTVPPTVPLCHPLCHHPPLTLCHH